MNLDSYYDQIIKDLGDEKRPRVNLACNEKTELIQLFESLSESELKSNLDEFKKVLCIVCHLSAPSSEFQEGFNRLLLNKKLPKKLIPQVFQGIDHHYLGFRQISGERLSSNFLTSLKSFISNTDKEGVHWALQIIDGMGSQSLFFKDVIKKLNWGFMDAFSQQNRMSIQIIERLNKYWENFSPR